jgi:antitoxin component of RelBE/YafQ-DinJ toxin-antitoxin module
MKNRATFNVDEKLKERFKATAELMGQTQSYLINEFFRDYCIKNKAAFNEKLLQLKNNTFDDEK